MNSMKVIGSFVCDFDQMNQTFCLAIVVKSLGRMISLYSSDEGKE